MQILAIDVGSSSVKMGIVRDGRIVGQVVRTEFPTQFNENRAEVAPEAILSAMEQSAKQLGDQTRRIDVIAIDSMAPSWIAMDSKGRPLTPIITHQDRRSTDIAQELEKNIGKERHLKLAGNRPIPGGISSTTCAWFLRHQRSLMGKADLIGHVTTFLHRVLCGTRVVDPSHASFMGLYSTLTLNGWNEELCDAVGVSQKILPEIKNANHIGGHLPPNAAQRLGVLFGTPMLVGMIDTGCALLLAGAESGQLVNVVGSTDVLALCTERPKPRERLLTRALGVGKKWVSVGTIAAAGTTLKWAHEQLFPELSEKEFFDRVHKLSRKLDEGDRPGFEPYLAGDRTSVEQRRGALTNLTLSTTRQQMLEAIVDSLAAASAERIGLLRSTGTMIHRHVLVSGGGEGHLAKLMQRDWKGLWHLRNEPEATLRGLHTLAGIKEHVPRKHRKK